VTCSCARPHATALPAKGACLYSGLMVEHMWQTLHLKCIVYGAATLQLRRQLTMKYPLNISGKVRVLRIIGLPLPASRSCFT
jgi:hypothetical protein